MENFRLLACRKRSGRYDDLASEEAYATSSRNSRAKAAQRPARLALRCRGVAASDVFALGLTGAQTPGSGTSNISTADYIRAVPTIDFTDAEIAAVTAAIRRTIEDDKFPHAPRLVPMRTAMAKLDEAVNGRERGDGEGDGAEANPAPEGPAASQRRQAGAAITGAGSGESYSDVILRLTGEAAAAPSPLSRRMPERSFLSGGDTRRSRGPRSQEASSPKWRVREQRKRR